MIATALIRNRIGWLIVATILVVIAQLMVGSMGGGWSSWIVALIHPSHDSMQSIIIYQSRLPSAIAATFGGAALGLSGLLMQTYFRNPIAGPYVLGISSGASLGAAIYIMLSYHLGWCIDSSWGLILFATAGACGIFIIVMFVSHRISGSVVMLIIGLMVATFTNGIIEIIQTVATAESIRGYLFWTMGSFRQVTLSQLPILIVVIGVALIVCIPLSKPLNMLLAGDEQARLSGLNILQLRWQLMLCTCLLAGTMTAFCGPVGFVGLAAPHIARAMFRTSNHRILLPVVMLTGALLCGICNMLTAVNIIGLTLPLSTITALLGAPVVIWIVYQNREIR